jgi:anti-sigma regulatory factor (Ser/Thr protein kinase)
VPSAPFRHEAFLYAGDHELVDGLLPFLRDGIEADDATLVVLAAPKIAALEDALGDDADRIEFADMDAVGANPARIIPAWREFVDAHPGKRLRGIGEPIWAARTPAEMAECHRHEGLLNVAFADTPGFWLMCPYDTTTLDRADLERACATHPHVAGLPSDAYPGLDSHAGPFADPLPPPAAKMARFAFDAHTLQALRRFVADRATRAGLAGTRAHDFLLAVNEIAANSVRHGGGRGELRIWQDNGALVCDVKDGGRISKPLAGRERPEEGQSHGYGLWLANQLCDLVQVRTFPTGNTVRLHMRFTSAIAL